MTPQTLTVGKSVRLEMLDRIKRSDGLSVQELAQMLVLSPSGLKQHCDDLIKEGYLDTWRRSQAIGRPEKIYRLTSKAQGLFATSVSKLSLSLLRQAAKLYGPAAPEKLLFGWFEEEKARYCGQVKGDTIELRLRSLARLREEEGCLPAIESDPWRLIEFHSPTAKLQQLYPIVTRFETELLSAALEVPVKREEKTVSGLYRCEFVPRI